jgi:hypothetical protein
LVRLRNPAGLIDGNAAAAELTLAALLDLGGRGIRALEFVPALDTYLVLAGAFDDAGNFALFRWSGDAAVDPTPLRVDFGGLKPEEMILLQASGSSLQLRLLSDDGTDECKAAAPHLRGFRTTTVALQL